MDKYQIVFHYRWDKKITQRTVRVEADSIKEAIKEVNKLYGHNKDFMIHEIWKKVAGLKREFILNISEKADE